MSEVEKLDKKLVGIIKEELNILGVLSKGEVSYYAPGIAGRVQGAGYRHVETAQLEVLGDEELRNIWASMYSANNKGQYGLKEIARAISQATIEDIKKKNGQLYRRKE